MENKRYDKQLRAMLTILEDDYAGSALAKEPVDSRYYIQSAGMAWKQGSLDALTFLRFGSQMLATTKDRSLRLALTAPDYATWRAGFDARRISDSLYVTAVQEDDRLRAERARRAARRAAADGRGYRRRRSAFRARIQFWPAPAIRFDDGVA